MIDRNDKSQEKSSSRTPIRRVQNVNKCNGSNKVRRQLKVAPQNIRLESQVPGLMIHSCNNSKRSLQTDGYPSAQKRSSEADQNNKKYSG